MFHGIILPTIFFWWLFGHGVGSVFGILITIWIISMIFHPWRRWGWYHPYYDRRWGTPPSSALSVLEERYAKGEIQREEYIQKKNDLLNRGA